MALREKWRSDSRTSVFSEVGIQKKFQKSSAQNIFLFSDRRTDGHSPLKGSVRLSVCSVVMRFGIFLFALIAIESCGSMEGCDDGFLFSC